MVHDPLKPFRNLAVQWRSQAALCDHDAQECWRPGQDDARKRLQARAQAFRDLAQQLEQAIVAAEAEAKAHAQQIESAAQSDAGRGSQSRLRQKGRRPAKGGPRVRSR